MIITKQRRIVTIRLVQFHNLPFLKLIQCHIRSPLWGHRGGVELQVIYGFANQLVGYFLNVPKLMLHYCPVVRIDSSV